MRPVRAVPALMPSTTTTATESSGSCNTQWITGRSGVSGSRARAGRAWRQADRTAAVLAAAPADNTRTQALASGERSVAAGGSFARAGALQLAIARLRRRDQ